MSVGGGGTLTNAVGAGAGAPAGRPLPASNSTNAIGAAGAPAPALTGWPTDLRICLPVGPLDGNVEHPATSRGTGMIRSRARLRRSARQTLNSM
jgi:hypothetical protein